MDTVWEIPPQDQQDIYVLFEDDSSNEAPPSTEVREFGRFDWDGSLYYAQSGQLEILESTEMVHLSPSELHATVGSIHTLLGDEPHYILASDLGERFVGRFKRGIRPAVGYSRGRATFVTTSSLHKGTYVFRQLRVEFRRDPGMEEWRIPVHLPLMRIHRPHREGCTAEMTVRTTEKYDGSATFEFLGIKGGGGQGLTTELSTKLSAGSICKEESIPATLLIEHGATLVNDQAVAYGARYRIVDLDPTRRVTRPIPAEIDGCGRSPNPEPPSKPRYWATFDKTSVTAGEDDSDDEGVKVGSTDYVSVGLGTDIGASPLKLSLEMKRTMEWEFETKTTLTGGASYFRYPVGFSAEQLPFEICWSVLAS